MAHELKTSNTINRRKTMDWIEDRKRSFRERDNSIIQIDAEMVER